MNASDFATFFLLIGLELVLGIDNVLLISIVTGRLPKAEQALARRIALGLALVLRVLLVMGAAYIVKLNDEVIWGLSWKGIVLIAGGIFLLYKSVKEIHHVVEGEHETQKVGAIPLTFGAAITQLVLLDLVFSIDSVITAVGLSNSLLVIISAVVLSFAVVLYSASAISAFVDRHPAMKILALSFLVTIGVTLFMEGMGHHVPKGYIYLPMGFALAVELLQMRYSSKRRPQA
ncbi:MAG TPA: TerC family protein [Bdellovibrionota bacterium]|jgi:predicted tellurium resistance membrane protein TerC|nr:TerC family protein [Bdellovibrionota bacterium]